MENNEELKDENQIEIKEELVPITSSILTMEEADSIVKKIPRGNKDDRRQRKVGKGKSRDVSRKEKNYDEEDLSADLDDPSSDGKEEEGNGIKKKRFKKPNSKVRSDKGRKKFPDRVFKCEHCEYFCKKPKYMTRHMRRHTGEKPFSCDCCEQKFSSSSGLNDHRRRLHSSFRPHPCTECEKAFASATELKQHMKVHSDVRAYQCTECGTRMKSLDSLNRHIRSHSGIQPYSCEKCEARFSCSSHLSRHKAVHENIKPYCCDLCDKSFAQNDNLKHHIKTVHEKIKEHSCDVCSSKFSRKRHLMDHMRCIHKIGKLLEYPCDKCDRIFSRLGARNRHYRMVHLKQLKYACTSCNLRFGCLTKLKRHSQSMKHIKNSENRMKVEGEVQDHYLTDDEISIDEDSEDEEIILSDEDLI